MYKNLIALKRVINELRDILSPKQQKHAIIVLFVIVIGSGFELLGVTAILPFLQAIISPDVVMNNKYIQPVIKILSIESSKGLLLLIGVMIILIYILKNVFLIFSQYVQHDYGTKIQKELSIKMLYSYMRRPYTFFMNINSADILRGCTGDIDGVYRILADLFTIIAEVLATIAIGIFIVYTDPLTAIAALILVFCVMIGIVLGFKPIVKRMGRKNINAQTAKNKAIYQSVHGIKELFAMQRKDLFVEEYTKAAEDVRIAVRNYNFLNNSPDRIVEGICISGLIGIVLVRLVMDIDMIDFIPKLGSFAMAAFKILPSIGKISNRVTNLVYYMPQLNNVHKIMMEADIYEKSLESDNRKRIGSNTVSSKVTFEEKVSVENVVWQYEGQEKPVLNKISIILHKGESIALIGASGSGKTTLADVILGLLRPAQGSVYVDGTDIYTVPEEWAKIVGYVPQSVFLIDDTIRNNIAFGLKDIDDKLIWRALEQAQLKDFVKGLPQGLDTIVGERGIKFSGGQRQRIAIARALYNKPEILILDEATAALDNETEKAVMESIDALQGKITMIIVAHRLTTIRNCDAIYEIKDGKALLRSKDEVFV